MTTDVRLHRIVAAHPYPLFFTTAHLYRFPSPYAEFHLHGAQVLPLEKDLLVPFFTEGPANAT